MLRLLMGFLKSQTGSVGILSLIVMVLLGAIGAAYVALSNSEVNASASYRNGVAAQFLAEAGARRAIVELDKNSNWSGATATMGTGVTAGRYTVSVTKTGQNCTVISVGTVGNSNRKMVLRLTLGSSAASVFNYPLFSQSNMNIGNSDVYGSARSNGTINLNNGANVSQDVIAQGDVNGKNNAVVGGQVLAHQSAITVPTYNKTDYSTAPAISSVGKHETVTLDGNKYYSSGEFKIDNPNGKLIGNATIYVAGNVLIENGAEISGNIFIIAEGDINVKQGASVNSAVLYSKQNINFEENSVFKGSAVASGTININNNAAITWDSQIVSYFGLSSGNASLTINSWGNQ